MIGQIVLASASPRRQELLRQIGLSFTVRPSQKEEQIISSLPARAVEELSFQKASDIAEQLQAEAVGNSRAAQIKIEKNEAKEGAASSAAASVLVIGADTVVACNGKILGKPADEQDAAAMLSLLQGRSHQVYTGVTLLWKETDAGKAVEDCWQQVTFHVCTEVFFYPMSRKEILSYVETKEPMDKAGSYGIQGRCAAYIEKICGDYNNVVGLPIGRLYQELAKRGLMDDKNSDL